MAKLNVFGQLIDETERAKNCAMINDLVDKTNKKNQAIKTIRECDNSIVVYDNQIKEKSLANKKNIDFNKQAEEVAEKAFKDFRVKNAGKGLLSALFIIFSILVVGATVFSLINLFPMIKDHMDITVILLLVGSPIVLIFLMPVVAVFMGEKKSEFSSESIIRPSDRGDK
jgi:hypothetical protein